MAHKKKVKKPDQDPFKTNDIFKIPPTNEQPKPLKKVDTHKAKEKVKEWQKNHRGVFE